MLVKEKSINRPITQIFKMTRNDSQKSDLIGNEFLTINNYALISGKCVFNWGQLYASIFNLSSFLFYL